MTLHPFEEAGLGKAPFKFVGHERRVGPIDLGEGRSVGAPGQPMGTCDHCGMGIADCYHVESSDGKRFVVGCQCIEKLYNSKNRTTRDLHRDPAYREFKKEKNRIATARRHAREKQKIAEGKEWAEAHEAELKKLPNPNREGESRWDQYIWFMKNAGNAGCIRLLKRLKELV